MSDHLSNRDWADIIGSTIALMLIVGSCCGCFYALSQDDFDPPVDIEVTFTNGDMDTVCNVANWYTDGPYYRHNPSSIRTTRVLRREEEGGE